MLIKNRRKSFVLYTIICSYLAMESSLAAPLMKDDSDLSSSFNKKSNHQSICHVIICTINRRQHDMKMNVCSSKKMDLATGCNDSLKDWMDENHFRLCLQQSQAPSSRCLITEAFLPHKWSSLQVCFQTFPFSSSNDGSTKKVVLRKRPKFHI